MLRVAEEANLHGINFVCSRSDVRDFSCYGVTANANMLPGGFAIIFGNENASSWKDFWWFVLRMHPLIDRGEVTIILDQDKGIKSIIEEVFQSIGHFFCFWHHIVLQCGGAGG